MKIRLCLFAGVLSAGLLAAGSAASADVLYSNGPTSGTIGGYSINNGFEVSDSFVLSSPGMVGSASIGVWDLPGDTVSQLQWSIGTTEEGDDIGSGTSSVTDVSTDLPAYGPGTYDVYDDTFSISDISLSAGTTYYLTISDAAASNGDDAYWDVNNGPSAAYQNGSSIADGYGPGTTSESFTLYSANAVPEPSSLPMLLAGLGLIGGAFYFGRKKVLTA